LAWARLHDGFDDDPDIDRLSGDAIALFVCSITWSSRSLTDGFIPEARARKLAGGTPEAIELLCSGDKPWWVKAEGGYVIRSFHKYNPSAEEVRRLREEVSQARAEAGRKGAEARWSKLDGKTDGKTADLPMANDGKNMAPVPVSRFPVSGSPKKEKAPPPLWLEFLAHYPKRSGSTNRAEAERRFAKLFSGPDGDAIVEGAKRYRAWADASGHSGTEFVAQMTTWLGQQRWQETYELPQENGPRKEVEPLKEEPVSGQDYVLQSWGDQARYFKPNSDEPFNAAHWFDTRNLIPTRRWAEIVARHRSEFEAA